MNDQMSNTGSGEPLVYFKSDLYAKKNCVFVNPANLVPILSFYCYISRKSHYSFLFLFIFQVIFFFPDIGILYMQNIHTPL